MLLLEVVLRPVLGRRSGGGGCWARGVLGMGGKEDGMVILFGFWVGGEEWLGGLYSYSRPGRRSSSTGLRGLLLFTAPGPLVMLVVMMAAPPGSPMVMAIHRSAADFFWCCCCCWGW